jgi:hypothetical protein
MSDTAATYETPADAGEGEAGEVRLWLEAIDLSRKTEEAWRKRATAAIERYRDDQERAGKGAQFNILFANVSTTLPAIYNSTPIPDVRRRYRDTDAVGKVAAQVIERGLAYNADEQDFDGLMRACAWDMEVPGRAVAWVKYEPVLSGDEIVSEAAPAEFVPWDDFLRGPGRRWEDVPWVGRIHRLTREELKELSPRHGATLPMDIVDDVHKGKDPREVPDVFKRATVYCVWDKQSRRVLFIAPTLPTAFLKAEDDPLGLRDFFPCPRPMYSILDPGSLVPLVPFELYRDQARELDEVTRRIAALVKMLRYRGVVASDIPEIARLADADDGEFVPAENVQQIMMAGGLDKALWVAPIETIRSVLDGLLLHREQIKQVIYEITGLSDILRGASKATETATAQQIKSQWGSLRIQDRQVEVARFARDLFRIQAEIMCEKFQPQTLAAITGIDLPPAEAKAQAQQAIALAQQAQQEPPPEAVKMAEAVTWDDVLAVLRSDAMRCYRVDIETDSTIQNDVARLQENAARFVEGFGAYIQAVGPAVQSGQFPREVAVRLAKAFSRSFKLGREAEGALEEWGTTPAPQQPDPNAAAMRQAQMEAQMRQAETQQSAQLEAAKLAQAGELEREKIASTERMKAAELDAQAALERQRMDEERLRHEQTLYAERERFGAEAQMRQAEGERAAVLEREKMGAQERQSAEAARAKNEPAQNVAAALGEIAMGVEVAVKGVEAVAQDVAALSAAVSEIAEDVAAVPEIVRGPDGRVAQVKKGRRTMNVRRGADGRAEGFA